MFNFTVVEPTQYIPTHVDVHEHRAPTDASVSLLNDMQGAALKNILSVNRLKNNELDVHWTVMECPAAMELRGVCRYKLNGKEHSFTVELDRFARSCDHARIIMTRVMENIAENLAFQLLRETHYEQLVMRRL